jgi:beta-phosphoglucomutase-like phosphatase (HAD superfamily)
MPLDALVFDIDGTMADTEEGHRCAFNLAFERFGLAWRWDRTQYHALLRINGGKERLAHFIGASDEPEDEKRRLARLVPQIHAEKTKFYSSLAGDGGIPLRPGVERLIDEAREAGVRLGIASTTTRANIDALLRATLGPRSVAWFSAIACGDEAAQKKPAPDIYRLALRRLEHEAPACVALEDSANGLRAATAAGLQCVVTPTHWTEHDDFAGALLMLPHLGEPTQPLPGEPGDRLRDAAWLTLGELSALSERAAAC